MCLSPYVIENPYRGYDPNKGLNYLHDCKSEYIQVPCGRCSVCVALKQSYFVQRVQCETFENYLFFGTLTYNQEMLCKATFNGYTFNYADVSDVQRMLKRIRKREDLPRRFSYVFCSEFGGKRHRPHWHFIISVPKYSSDDKWTPYNLEYEFKKIFLEEWCVNVGSKRVPIYKPLSTFIDDYRGRTYDFHYIRSDASNDGEADVAFYVSKYILKFSDYVDRLHSALKLNLDEEVFDFVWYKVKPRFLVSKSFGLCRDSDGNISKKVHDHIRKGIDLSVCCLSTFPFFINPISGQTFPLAPFYRKYFLTLSDATHFSFMQSDNDLYTHIDAIKEIQDYKQKQQSHYFNLDKLSFDEECESFEDLI